MKRRTEASNKLRRSIKRNSGNSSALFFYLKIVLIWSIVICCDTMSELRFEYLWPFWLLCRSVFDSYKYKGLTFSFLFICIAITSDLICLFLIPLNWIFFVASTFVWIQFIWIHTEKGICLPTILIWLLFVYMEAKVRWKDNQKMPHLDLCRPFAAHCVGYPVVSLGFGFKSYLGYKIRQRKQKEMAKENEFYMQLLQQALPKEDEVKNQEQLETSSTSTTSNGNITQCKAEQSHQKNQTNGSIDPVSTANVNGSNSHNKHHNYKKNAEKENAYLQTVEQHNHQDLPNNIVLATKSGTKANNLNFNNLQSVKNTNTTNSSYQQIQSSIKELNVSTNNKCSPYKNNTYISSNACKKEYEKEKIIKDTSYEDTNGVETSNQKKKEKSKDNQQYHQQHQAANNEKAKPCEQCCKSDQEAKRLKSEISNLKSFEQETKQKLDMIKGTLSVKQRENDESQKQIADLQNQERRNRQFFESQIKELKERKNRKPVDEKPIKFFCPESCKIKKMQIENENNKMRRDLMLMEETKQNLEKLLYEQNVELRKYDRNRDLSQNADMALRTALAVMQEKNLTLEKNLSAETRVKLDLFSALGEARRQLEIKDDYLRNKEMQLEDLKAKTAQILAVSQLNLLNEVNSQLG